MKNVADIVAVNTTIRTLVASGKVVVNNQKKLAYALKGKLSCSLSGGLDHLKKFGVKLILVDELPAH